jgi:PASTA domain
VALEGDYDVFGKKLPKKYVLGGVLVGGGIAVVSVLRSRSAATASTAADVPDATAVDPTIDPATGVPYADEQGNSGAYGSDYGGSGGSYGSTGGYDAAGYPIGSPADIAWEDGATGVSGVTGGITTNDEWLQQALADLPGSQTAIQSALLGVLAGQTVTTGQKVLFLEAVALNGQPPGGYPTPIKTSDTAAQPGAGAEKVKVPTVVGETQESAFTAISAAGLKASGSKVQPGKTLIVKSTSPKGGTMVAKNSTVHVVSSVPAVRK